MKHEVSPFHEYIMDSTNFQLFGLIAATALSYRAHTSGAPYELAKIMLLAAGFQGMAAVLTAFLARKYLTVASAFSGALAGMILAPAIALFATAVVATSFGATGAQATGIGLAGAVLAPIGVYMAVKALRKHERGVDELGPSAC